MSTNPAPKNQYKIQLPPTAKRDITLIVLLADTPNPAVLAQFGDYGDVFTRLFQRAVDLAASEAGASATQPAGGHTLTIESYEAVLEQLPTAERIKEADGILITGSAASAYLDLPWIVTLVSFVRSLPALKPSLKLIGICFGHQIIARAFGHAGSKGVEKNPKGWEVGTRAVELNETGTALFGDSLAIQHMHGDIITAVPEGFLELATTEVCRHQGMIRLVDPQAPVAPENIAVFTVQGHPEFTAGIVQLIIDAREKSGVFSAELTAASRKAAEEGHDGVRIARLLLTTLGGF